MRVVLVDKRGLVLANFAGALTANRSVLGKLMLIVRKDELSRAEARRFTRAIKALANKNKWGNDILDIELQYLRQLT